MPRELEEVKVRGLALTLDLLERELATAIADARAAGVDSVSLAQALGVARSTLYRRWPVPGDEKLPRSRREERC